MHSPLRQRFERVAFCALIAGAALLGYSLGTRSSPDAKSRGARASTAALPVSAGNGSAPAARDLSEEAAAAAGQAVATPDRAGIYQHMIAALNEPISTERWMMLAGVLQGLSPANWRGVLQALDDERRLHGRENADARAFFVRRAGEVVGRDALTEFVALKDRDAVTSALTG
jgi:hypothetical protein